MQGGVTTTRLAEMLGVTKGRVSQYVAQGQLDGCYTGEGRSRRFDPEAVARQLNRTLDPGQMLGNGAATKRRIAELQADGSDEDRETRKPALRDSAPLEPQDPDRYNLAKTQLAEEQARKLRRQNAEEAGRFVLASAVQAQVSRQMAQEIAQVETMLRDGARRIADEMGVDYLTARRHLIDVWRAHRAARSGALEQVADDAKMSDDEKAGDF